MTIHIEFCIKWNYGPEFDRVSKILKGIIPNCNITGNKTPPRSGAFEITINNDIVYSKFITSSFPTETELKKILNNLI